MKYKIIQWATGAMGKSCLRAIIDHPNLELVGLYVYSGEKAGRDAGEIARRDPTGVKATRHMEDILALDADVVVHAPRIQPPYAYHNDNICRLLSSGKNVISINGHTYPQYWGAEYAGKFETACRKGNSSLFGTGLNPGFIVEKTATTAIGLCTEIDSIVISEVVDCTTMQDPNYVFDVLGFGSEAGTIDPNLPSWSPAELLNGMFSEVVAQLVVRMGYQLDSVETDHIMLPATKDIQVAAGLIKKGTIGHTNWRWHGVADERRLVTLSISWIMETAHLENAVYPLWHIDINGYPGISIDIDLRKPDNYPFKTSPEQLAVAASVVNSIPPVCAADPGIVHGLVAHHFKASV